MAFVRVYVIDQVVTDPHGDTHMKKLILSSLVAASSLFAAQAKADLIGPGGQQTGGPAQAVSSLNLPGYNYVYLGASWGAAYCSQTAAVYGYPYYYFGPANVTINGMPTTTYITNACFGLSGGVGPGPGPVGQSKDYNVFVKAGVTATDCVNAISFQLGAQNVNCYEDTDHLHCTSKIGGVKDKLEQISCVAGVDPLSL
jgi:hypothetical protein